jgi:hypothetical protein
VRGAVGAAGEDVVGIIADFEQLQPASDWSMVDFGLSAVH